MYANVSGSMVETRGNLQKLAKVGPVREMRLLRDTEIRTIHDVATADLDTLMQVWSVGPKTSRSMKGSAQAHCQAVEAERNALSRTPRVAVVTGKDAFDDLHDSISPREVLETALEIAGVDYTDEVEIGYCADGMGGDKIGFWMDREQYRNRDLLRCSFRTPWDKYKRFTNPIEFVDQDWKSKHDVWDIDEVPKGRMPELPNMARIPFCDRPEDVQLGMAAIERTNDMVNWADEVVILLDGEYADSFRSSCDYRETKCTTVFCDPKTYPRLKEWIEPEQEDEAEFVVDDDEQATGGRGVATGVDLENDDLWIDGAFDTDEDRLRGKRNDLHHADPGGKGVGPHMNKW